MIVDLSEKLERALFKSSKTVEIVLSIQIYTGSIRGEVGKCQCSYPGKCQKYRRNLYRVVEQDSEGILRGGCAASGDGVSRWKMDGDETSQGQCDEMGHWRRVRLTTIRGREERRNTDGLCKKKRIFCKHMYTYSKIIVHRSRDKTLHRTNRTR